MKIKLVLDDINLTVEKGKTVANRWFIRSREKYFGRPCSPLS